MTDTVANAMARTAGHSSRTSRVFPWSRRHLHEHSVAHRDLKSANVGVPAHGLCCLSACAVEAVEAVAERNWSGGMTKVLLFGAPRWVAKVADFGLAKLTDRGEELGLAPSLLAVAQLPVRRAVTEQ